MIEERVAEVMLEEKKTITIQGETYNVASPTIETLILFSKYVSKLPNEALSETNPVASLVANADTMHNIGFAIASIILGSIEFNMPIAKEQTMPVEKKRTRAFFRKQKPENNLTQNTIPENSLTQGEILANKINNADISEVLQSFITIVKFMRFTDFFQLTTSLIELNLTKRTKTAEVEN